ncbi:MAG: aspartate carbamoyltransferase [Burkholderiaceae bacterium]
MTKPRLLPTALLALFTAALAAQPADPRRQAEVAGRGSDVMPFSLAATTHVFTRTAQGGIQRVIAKNAADATQVRLVREHLQDIRTRFLNGDFSAPTQIHGDAMPGLASLKAAKPGQFEIDYGDVAGGAELRYRTEDVALVAALHRWFDAQLSDHGSDAAAGGTQHHHGAAQRR